MTHPNHRPKTPLVYFPSDGGEPLTERQLDVLRIVGERTRARGYSPTLREIGAAIGVRSTNCIDEHLTALRRKGFLKPRVGGAQSRTILMTDRGWAALGHQATAVVDPLRAAYSDPADVAACRALAPGEAIFFGAAGPVLVTVVSLGRVAA